MKGMFLSAVCAAAALAASTSAQAAPYRFVLTGTNTIKFVLDSSPTPTASSLGNYFQISGVTGTVDNVANTFELGFGGVALLPSNFQLSNSTYTISIFSTGDILFTGTEAAPTFKLGTFNLVSQLPGVSDYSLTISAVPEPASWAMLLAGFGALGMAARRRSDRTVRVRFNA